MSKNINDICGKKYVPSELATLVFVCRPPNNALHPILTSKLVTDGDEDKLIIRNCPNYTLTKVPAIY